LSFAAIGERTGRSGVAVRRSVDRSRNLEEMMQVAQATAATIRSEALSVGISTLGAELQRITDNNGRQLLWDGDPAVWHGRAPILFPVIGLLVNGSYRLDGTVFPMPKHGFARDSVFEIVTQADDRVTMRLSASDKTRAIYPFEFRLDIGFALAANMLRITATVSNLGARAMPASFGFHPAFRWPLPFGRPRDEHRIRFAHDEPEPIRRIDTQGLLKPAPEPTPVRGNELVIRDQLFVDDAVIFDRLNSKQLDYGAPTGPQLRIKFDAFPTLGVWTKPGAGYLCIEPWQGFADPQNFSGDIRDKPGIMNLAAGEAREFVMSVSLVEEGRS
jgi:galactose mutarotase-like enzyme